MKNNCKCERCVAQRQHKNIINTPTQPTMQVSPDTIETWNLDEWYESYAQNLIKHFGKTKFEVGEILEYRGYATCIEWDEKEQVFCWCCGETDPYQFEPWFASSPEMVAQAFIWNTDTYYENDEYDRENADIGSSMPYRNFSVTLEYNERTKFYYGTVDGFPDALIAKCKTIKEFDTKFCKWVDDYLKEECR